MTVRRRFLSRGLRFGALLAFSVSLAPVIALPGPTTESAAASAQTSPGTLSGARPNIVLLLTDDQGIESIQRMPYLQAGLANGELIEFTEAEVNNSLCCPSRGAILSGQVDTRNGVLNNNLGRSLDTGTTVAVALESAGYRTGLIGKLLNGYNANWGRPPGWTDFQPNLAKNIYAQYNYKIWNNGVVESYGAAPEDYAVDVQTRKALDFLDLNPPGQPFFLMLTPTSTHTPYIAAPRHLGTFSAEPVTLPPNFSEADVSDKPQWVQQLPNVAPNGSIKNRRKQWDAALGVDDMLRSVEDRLRALGQLENTVVVFVSDNGLSQGAHRWSTKRCPYRECSNVPLIVRYPGQIGRTDSRLASNIDLAATFLDLAGTTPLAAQDGISLVPALEDPAGTVPTRDAILEHWSGGDDVGSFEPNRRPTPGYYAIRTAGWRYVEVTNLAADNGIEPELYDQLGDPFELTNLATDPAYADVVEELRARLQALITASGATPGQSQGEWRPGRYPDPGYHWVDTG